MDRLRYDVVVVGCGMAGLSAGLRAAELDRSVAILEKSPKEHRGGQTRFSESFRVPSAETDLSEWGYEFAIDDYTPDQFYEDVMDRTNGRADPELVRTLVENAAPTVEWLTAAGIEWDMEPLATGYTVGRTWFDGEQGVAAVIAAAEDAGAEVFYEAEARRLRRGDDGGVTGLVADCGDDRVRFDCDAVVVAAGGYESSPEKRARYYGAGYDDMKVRGSRYNTGGAIEMALDAGANACGQWSGAHMALIDAASPEVEGGANRVDGYQYGVILNVDGERFVDEGEDARAHTYAKFGRRIFEQPRHRAYVVLDARGGNSPVRRDPPNPTWSTRSTNWSPNSTSTPNAPWKRCAATTTPATPTSSTRTSSTGTRRPGFARRSRTGRSVSESRRTPPTRSPAASRSPSAASRSHPARRSSTPVVALSLGCTPRGTRPAGSSTTTTPAGLG
nr:FAD-dependent oxidoreductase [Salinigranum rubrum]